MLNRRIRVLTIACGFAIAVLSMPVSSDAGILSCLFGPAPCAAPVYAPAMAAPACGTCVPQTCGYMPTVVYRALYQPAVVTAYRPVVYQPAAPCNTCTGYAVTTYRPAFPWASQGRLVPYTTYRPVYAATPVVAYMGCNSCASYSPCDSCSPCGGGYGTVTYGAPTSGCASCAAPATVVAPAPSTGGGEAAPAMGTAPPKTFQEKVEKPATEPDLKPIPQTDTRLNSMPAPVLPDPRDRTAARLVRTPARVELIASSVQASPSQDNDGWQPARD